MPAIDQSSEPLSRRHRVLVVDDNRDLTLTLCLLLNDERYDVRASHDGRDALVELAEFEPDAVIADIGLPGANGWKLASAVRKITVGDRPLMIAISGAFTKDADRRLTKVSGFNYFLAKPFDAKVLFQLLASLNPSPPAP